MSECSNKMTYKKISEKINDSAQKLNVTWLGVMPSEIQRVRDEITELMLKLFSKSIANAASKTNIDDSDETLEVKSHEIVSVGNKYLTYNDIVDALSIALQVRTLENGEKTCRYDSEKGASFVSYVYMIAGQKSQIRYEKEKKPQKDYTFDEVKIRIAQWNKNHPDKPITEQDIYKKQLKGYTGEQIAIIDEIKNFIKDNAPRFVSMSHSDDDGDSIDLEEILGDENSDIDKQLDAQKTLIDFGNALFEFFKVHSNYVKTVSDAKKIIAFKSIYTYDEIRFIRNREDPEIILDYEEYIIRCMDLNYQSCERERDLWNDSKKEGKYIPAMKEGFAEHHIEARPNTVDDIMNNNLIKDNDQTRFTQDRYKTITKYLGLTNAQYWIDQFDAFRSDFIKENILCR